MFVGIYKQRMKKVGPGVMLRALEILDGLMT